MLAPRKPCSRKTSVAASRIARRLRSDRDNGPSFDITVALDISSSRADTPLYWSRRWTGSPLRSSLMRYQAQPGVPRLSEARQHLAASCRCGHVALETTGEPIVSVSCYCRSCQEAGRQFGRLPGAPVVLDADGGTGFALFLKGRVR